MLLIELQNTLTECQRAFQCNSIQRNAIKDSARMKTENAS